MYDGTPYYRPLLNLLLFLEYFLCGPNGISFRFFSLLYLLITAYILCLLIGEFAKVINFANISEKVANGANGQKLIGVYLRLVFFFFSLCIRSRLIGLFAPLELLVNIFILASFLFFIYWRNSNSIRFQFVSCLFAACAFLTKEVAVILPPILFVYELLVGGEMPTNTDNRITKLLPKNPEVTALVNKLFKVMKLTANYWFLLIIYLCLRKIMTGEFLGNWNNNVFHFSDNRMMFAAWWQSFKIILNPISSAVFNKNFPVHLAWILMLIDLIYLTLASAYKDSKKISLLLFLVCWFFISLMPMARLLYFITPDLLDARYGYIASMPLCILLMMGISL